MRRVLEERQYREWNELSEKEKDVHRFDYSKSSLCRCLSDSGADDVSFYIKGRLEELGLPNGDVSWSLSACQGDGVAFYGRVSLSEKLLVTLMDRQKDQRSDLSSLRYLIAVGHYSVEYRLFRNSYGRRYSHGRCIECEVYDVWGGDVSRLGGIGGTSRKIESVIHDIADMLLDYVREICDDLEGEGYQILWEAVSDDHIRDFCKEHGILFDEDNGAYWDCEHELDGSAGRVIIPILVVEIEGGVVVASQSNVPCRIVVMDHDAEIMDPQGYPEIKILSPEISEDAVAKAMVFLSEQEVFTITDPPS